MNLQPRQRHSDQGVQAVRTASVGRVAKVKALEPITSTGSPTLAHVVEYSDKKIMLRLAQRMTMGTVVQLHLDGEFSLWKVFCCIPTGDAFHLGLELVEIVSVF